MKPMTRTASGKKKSMVARPDEYPIAVNRQVSRIVLGEDEMWAPSLPL